ncbi:MAG: hypothetical protein AAGF78_05095 [Pseudomonadota bacterium]
MLEEKRSDLESEKRKRVLQDIVQELSAEEPELYYQSTNIIAKMIHQRIQSGEGMTQDRTALLGGLSDRDIEVLLSIK